MLSPAEMAYGLLWRLDHEPSTASSLARHILCAEIGREGQRRGIAWALEQFGEVSDAEMTRPAEHRRA